MGCLNTSNPQVAEWIDSVGFDETYRQYLNHNYRLPRYKAYLQKGAYAGLNREEIKVQLNKLLDTELYDFDIIEEILDLAPDAQAAFWGNTFYFADKANKLQVSEEAFHAIFQTLTKDENEKKELYRVAEGLLKDKAKRSGKSVEQIVKGYSASTKLSGNALYNYALEEELAKAFVNWYTYDNQLVAEASIKDIWKDKDSSFIDKIWESISKFFNKLASLVKGYRENKDFLETYFSEIKAGKYRLDSPVFSENSEFPALSTLRLISNTKAEEYVMDVVQQNLMYSKVIAIAHQVSEQVTKTPTSEIIQISIDAYLKHLEQSPGYDSNSLIQDVVGTLEEFEGTYTEARDILVKDLIERFVTRESQEDSIFDEKAEEEGEYEKERQWNEEANTIDHYSSLSKKIKAIMQTIQIPLYNPKSEEADKIDRVNHSFKNSNGVEYNLSLKINRMADPTKIYAAIVRATSNTGNDIEKLRNLILFTRDSDLNTDTKAFMDYTFSRLFGSINEVENAKQYILAKDAEKVRSLIKDSSYYQNISKAFDLWTRPSRIYEFEEAGGFFRSFNPNMTNVKSIQLDKWEKNWREKMATYSLRNINSYLSDPIFRQNREALPEFTENTDLSQLAYKSEIALTFVYEALGVNLSKNYIKYLVGRVYTESLGLGSTLPEQFKDLYETFLLEDSELDEDLFGFASALKGELTFDKDEVYLRDSEEGTGTDKGFVSRFEKLALGNAAFDESVLATSYLDADNKTRYAHQVKTYALRFLGSTVKDRAKLEKHVEELDSLSRESRFFTDNNEYLRFVNSLSAKEKNRLKFSSYGGAQVKDSKTNSKQSETVNEITAEDFVLLEANAVIDSVYSPRKEERTSTGMTEAAKSKLSTSYFTGFVEASNTLTMFTSKWFLDSEESKLVDVKETTRKITEEDIMAGDMAIGMAYSLLEQQFNRIKAIDSKIKSLLTPNMFTDNKLALELTDESLTKLGFNEDIIRAYHTGTVNYILDKEGNIELDLQAALTNRKLPRAFTLTNSLDGYYNNKEMIYNHFFSNTPIEPIQENIRGALNTLLDDMYDVVRDKTFLAQDYAAVGISEKASRLGFITHDEKARTLGATKKLNLSKFFLNSMFNREHFHRAAFGDSAVISKNDITDQSKRFKGFEGQMLSVKTFITNKFKGVLKPLLNVRYVTELSSANDSSDKNTSGLWDGVDKDSKKVDQDDAQSRTTVNFTRSYLHGLDRLSNDLVWVLDKVQNGTEFTQEEEKIIKDNSLYLAVEKSRGFGPQQDIKHGVQILRKLETSLKNEVTQDVSLEELERNIEINYTLKNNSSYFVTPKNGATRELTVEFNPNKYSSFQEAYLDNALKVFEWLPKSNHLHVRRKAMEGWRTVDGKDRYSPDYEFDLLSSTEAHKRRVVNVLDNIDNLDTRHIQNLDAEYYGRQVENPGKDAISDPSQQIEIITSSLSKTVDFIHNGVKQSVSKDVIVKQFQELLAKRDFTNIVGAINELKDASGNTNLKMFYESIIDTLKETGADRQLIESFSLKDGSPIINGNIPFIKNKLEQYLFAHYSKGVLVQKRDGDAKAMVSPRGQVVLKRTVSKVVNGKTIIGWESVPAYTKDYNKLFAQAADNRLEDLGLSFNGQGTAVQNTLQTKLNSMGAGVYFTDELRFNVPVERNGVIQYFTEVLMPKYNSKQAELQDSYRYLTGVRIPSQDKSTTANLMIVDFLDISGSNTIIAAKEIQHLSGADYDIDKIYTTYAEGYWIGNVFKLYDKSFEDYKKYIFKKNKTLKKQFSKILASSKELQEIDKNINLYKDNLGAYTFENFKEDHERIKEIESIFSSMKEYSSSMYSQRDAAIQAGDNKQAEEIQKRIRAFEVRKNFEEDKLEALNKELDSLYENAEFLKGEEKAIRTELNALLDKRYKLVEELKLESLASLKLPTTEQKFLAYYKDGEYNAIVNNNLLEISFSLLTSDAKAYSNITSVDPIRNIDKYSREKGFGILADSGVNFEETPRIPYHSPLFDLYYKKRLKAAQTGIGAAVNANLTFLLLTRIGMKLNPGYELLYKEGKASKTLYTFDKFTEKMPKFNIKENKNFRSDWISTIISVTTDEAKEGVLAKYNLQGDILTAFVTGLQIGVHPELLIALLNNKLIQSLNSQSERNPLVRTQQDSLSALIGTELAAFGKPEDNDPVLTRDVLVQGLQGMSTENDYAVLNSVLNLLVIAQQNADTVKVMRVKRGLKPTYLELTETIKAVKRLSLGGKIYNDENYPYVPAAELHNAYSLEKSYQDKSIAQFSNFVDNVLPMVYESAGSILLEGTRTFKNIANTAAQELNIPDYKKQEFSSELSNAFLGHTLAKIKSLPVMEDGQKPNPIANRQKTYVINPKKEDIVGEETLAKELESLLKDYPVLRDKNSNNPIFDRLIAKTAESKLKTTKARTAIDTISLNVFSKVSPELQSDMMDNFVQLIQPVNETDENERIKKERIRTFLMRLLDYYAGKDGLGYSPISVSKMFSPWLFEDVSNYFEHILQNQPVDSKITEEVLNRFVTDIRNIDYLYKLENKPKEGISLSFKHAGGSIVVMESELEMEPRKYYRQTTSTGTKVDSLIKHIGSVDGFTHYFLEYPALGHKDYKSSVAEGRFTYQGERKKIILNNLKTFKIPSTFPSNMQDLINKHVERLESIDDVVVSVDEQASQILKNLKTTSELYAYFTSLTKKQQARVRNIVQEKRKSINGYIFKEEKISPTDKNFNAKKKFYAEDIESLADNEVFVFGANDKGDHGAGSAGVAMGQQRKLAEIRAIADGTQGKWAVKGEHTKISQGLEGKSYGLVTVTGTPGGKNKSNRLSPVILKMNVEKLYKTALDNPELTFKVAYDAKDRNQANRSGYTPLELAVIFSSVAIPKNVMFEKTFTSLINEITGLEYTSRSASEETVSDAEQRWLEEQEALDREQEEVIEITNQVSNYNTIVELLGYYQTFPLEKQKKFNLIFGKRKQEISSMETTQEDKNVSLPDDIKGLDDATNTNKDCVNGDL